MARHTTLSYTPDEIIEFGEPQTVGIRGETFRLAAAVPGIIALKLGTLGDDSVDSATRMMLINRLLKSVIEPEDWARFEKLAEEATPVIDAQELVFYLNQMVELISGRPTEQRQDSLSLSLETPTTSTAGTGATVATLNGASSPSTSEDSSTSATTLRPAARTRKNATS
jgi:hypothetical protein